MYDVRLRQSLRDDVRMHVRFRTIHIIISKYVTVHILCRTVNNVKSYFVQ